MRLKSLSNPSVSYNSILRLSFHKWESNIALPSEFIEEVSKIENFMIQCFLVFELYPFSYSIDKVKVLFIVSYFSGFLFQWTQNIILDWYHSLYNDYLTFMLILKIVYFNYIY